MIKFAENLNKMIAAGLGGALEAPSTEVAVGHRIVYTEASGAVVNFETNLIAPVKNLRVTMEPIQNLNGQDSPYPAGGGKNLFGGFTNSGATVNGITYTFNTDGSIHAQGTATAQSNFQIAPVNGFSLPSGDFTISISCSDSNAKAIYVYGGSGTAEIAYNEIATIDISPVKTVTSAGGTTGYNILRFNSGTTVDANVYIQIESGSTASAWTPYENICPISGRDSVTVWREASYDPSADPALTIPLGQTVYGGTLDVSTGKLTVTHGEIASYNGEVLTGEWISDRDVYAAGTTPTIGAQVVYVLDTPQTTDLDPQQITTLIGDNNVWSDAGDVSLEYPYYEETEGY